MGTDTQPKARDRVVEVPLPQRLLWRDCHCAAMLGIGRATWLQLNRSELCPQPIRVGASNIKAWRAQEVRDWAVSGCPQRSLWSWKPAAPHLYDKLIAQKTRELESIKNELQSYEHLVSS